MGSKANATVFVLFAAVFVVVMALVYIFSAKILSDFNTEIQADSSFNDNVKNTTQTLTTQSTTTFDGIVLFFMIGCWIAMLIASWFMDANPVFFVVSILLVAMVLWVAMIMGNTYDEVTADGEISTFADMFPYTNFVIDHIVIIVLVMAFSSLIVVYGRSVL